MEQDSLPTEIILTHPRQSLGKVRLDWTPQPGNYLDLQGKTYTVLERRHRYHLRAGRYHLHTAALYVQSAQTPSDEKSFVDGCWIIGDASCKYNAYSEIIRCAVNPNGPCKFCQEYEKK
ncbi:MAG: DUF6464 family protein [Cyanobacteria bacterium P01_A01_bin.84]